MVAGGVVVLGDYQTKLLPILQGWLLQVTHRDTFKVTRHWAVCRGRMTTMQTALKKTLSESCVGSTNTKLYATRTQHTIHTTHNIGLYRSIQRHIIPIIGIMYIGLPCSGGSRMWGTGGGHPSKSSMWWVGDRPNQNLINEIKLNCQAERGGGGGAGPPPP